MVLNKMEDWYTKYNLSRDYLKDPLKFKEYPLEEDLQSLQNNTLLTAQEIASYFNRSKEWLGACRKKLGLPASRLGRSPSREVRMKISSTKKAYFKRHPEVREAIRFSQVQYHKDNSEKLKRSNEKRKQWWGNNPNKAREIGDRVKLWWKENPDKAKNRNQAHKNWRKENPDKAEKMDTKRKLSWNLDKIKEARKKNILYWKNHPEQLKEHKKRLKTFWILNPDKIKEAREKNILYWKNHPEQLKQINLKIREYWQNVPEEVKRKRVQKNHDTKKQNGTLGMGKETLIINNVSYKCSKVEKQIYFKLKEKYPRIEFQKHVKGYGTCDFYIPELDLYLECQAIWTHGPEPYNLNNPEHIKLLREWQSKPQTRISSGGEEVLSYYTIAIKQWTILDPKRRNWMKEHGYNFLEYFPSKDNDLEKLIDDKFNR
jgi:hypothetical protein